MILAAAIAVLLLGALYVAMDLQLRQAETARDLVEQATLSRRLLRTIANDITPSIGVADPSRYRSTSGSGSGSSGTASTGGAGSATTGSSTPSTGGGATTSGSSSSSATTGSASASGPNPTLIAVQGDSATLTLVVSRVPRTAVNPDNPEIPLGFSDQRRVSYFLAGGAASPLGLARYEVEATTSDEAANPPPDVTDPESKLIFAKEVKSLTFRYFDGSAWQESWDSSAVGSDGMTPVGPPAAIEIQMSIAPPTGSAIAEGEVKTRTYRHVVAIPTANGAAQATTTDSSSSGTTSP
jgi:hypothetical protein